MKERAFDNEASIYDSNFTNTGIGKAQRNQVWRLLDLISKENSNNILEINCGTGEDAKYWVKRSVHYTGTDISSQMIEVARKKVPSAVFDTSGFEEVCSKNAKFDIIFSNFGGLNCVDYLTLTTTIQALSEKLNPGGKIICVLMGRKCIWDNFFLLLKGKLKHIGRRNTDNPIKVNVANTDVNTWYYSPKQIKKIKGVNSIKLNPIGLFVPPSYLSSYFDKRPKLLRFLNTMDRRFSFRFLSNFADHYYIELEKSNLVECT